MSPLDERFVDHYAVLEVERNADKEAILKAYSRLTLVNHPDVVGSCETHDAITASFAVLFDPSTRLIYDKTYGDACKGHYDYFRNLHKLHDESPLHFWQFCHEVSYANLSKNEKVEDGAGGRNEKMEDVEQSQDELQSFHGTETPQEHHLPEQLALDDDSSEESKKQLCRNRHWAAYHVENEEKDSLALCMESQPLKQHGPLTKASHFAQEVSKKGGSLISASPSQR